MNEFYVEKREDENGAHVVHMDCCPSLPAKDKLHLIGVRASLTAPLQEAAYFWYSKSAPCPECMGS